MGKRNAANLGNQQSPPILVFALLLTHLPLFFRGNPIIISKCGVTDEIEEKEQTHSEDGYLGWQPSRR